MTKRKKTGIVLNCDEDGTPRCKCHDERMVPMQDAWMCATGVAITTYLQKHMNRGIVPDTFRGPNYKEGGSR